MPKVAEPPGAAGEIRVARERVDRVRDLTSAAAAPGDTDSAVDAHLHTVNRAQEHAVRMGVNLVDLPPMNPKPLRPGRASQGTLWDPRAMKPSPEHRWAAHGYSPERRDAIAAAIPKVGVSSSFSYPGGSKAVPFEGTVTGGVYPAIGQVGGKRKNQVAAPLEDIVGATPDIKVQPMARAAGQHRTKFSSLEGPPLAREIKLHPGGGPERTRASIEHTVLHEFGHNVDFEADRRRFVTLSRHDLPAVEGFAEGYSAKHTVFRRNDPSTYADVAAYKGMHKRPSFGENFERASGQPLAEAMGAQKHLGEQWRQPTLFEKEQPPEISDEDWKHLTHRPANNFILKPKR
jgi:hypothetical protein